MDQNVSVIFEKNTTIIQTFRPLGDAKQFVVIVEKKCKWIMEKKSRHHSLIIFCLANVCTIQ